MLTAFVAWTTRHPCSVLTLFCLGLVMFNIASMSPGQDHCGMLNARFDRDNRLLWRQNADLHEGLRISKEKVERLESELSKINHIPEAKKREELALKTESILKLEKLVNQLEILNRNLSIKQEQLEAEVLKWEEQTNQCKRSLTIVNDQLNTAKQDLKSCERDRDACRAQLNHTNTVQPHIVLIALLVTFLKLLYS
ncbi:uncharacterized protein LOC119953395 isoform X1 [Scyliorhinus canicula]|uniref:uncharacterized protein LOC119953395 isoform X1 n=1 Tax=Scyliorhinus canicula TaxID=7830 RepID=UPI0018F2E5A0|nr:uncharacterized protein LOC119953395 isoform X1 [Scyliorhinus canicula]